MHAYSLIHCLIHCLSNPPPPPSHPPTHSISLPPPPPPLRLNPSHASNGFLRADKSPNTRFKYRSGWSSNRETRSTASAVVVVVVASSASSAYSIRRSAYGAMNCALAFVVRIRSFLTSDVNRLLSNCRRWMDVRESFLVDIQ